MLFRYTYRRRNEPETEQVLDHTFAQSWEFAKLMATEGVTVEVTRLS